MAHFTSLFFLVNVLFCDFCMKAFGCSLGTRPRLGSTLTNTT